MMTLFIFFRRFSNSPFSFSLTQHPRRHVVQRLLVLPYDALGGHPHVGVPRQPRRPRPPHDVVALSAGRVEQQDARLGQL